jgi:branched-chain amino acid transport system substrate-binding protein
MSKFISVLIFVFANTGLAFAEQVPGVTDTEITVGAHTSESGAMAVVAPLPKAVTAYFDMINAKGGVNGRKIKFIRIDTQGEHIKTVEATKKLVEEDHIFAMVAGHGASHQAVYKYLLEKGVPDMFHTDDLIEYTTPLQKLEFPGQFSYIAETAAYAEDILENYKGKKVCFLISDNSAGEEFLRGAKETLEKGNKSLKDNEKVVIGAVEHVDRLAAQGNSQVLN